MKLTDALISVLSRNLEIHRHEIDNDPAIASVSVIVNINERSGAPYKVIFRKESRDEAVLDKGVKIL